MAHVPKIEFEPYLDIAWRRKWWVVGPLVGTLLLGLVYLLVTPKAYRASTLILVEPKSIPDAYVRSTVTESVDRILRTIIQQVHSRTNLEEMIKRFGLDEDRGTGLDVVARIKRFLGMGRSPAEREQLRLLNLTESIRRNNIGISLSGRDRSQAFEISFTWHDPKVAANVANALAQRFIDENLNVREERAMTTTDFLDRETARIRQELEEKEKALETFKRENMGMLPTELQSNMSILNQLKEELNNLEKRLDTEKQTAFLLESQMQMQSSLMTAGADDFPSTMEALPVPEVSSDVEVLEAELRALRTRYTDHHPDIIALKRTIEAAKKEANERKAGSGLAEESSMDAMISPVDALAAQKDMTDQRVQLYLNQIEEIKSQMKIYKDRVERTPQVELMMTKISRDYETVQQRYQDLLAKKLDARMAEELERRQKGEQFRVIDPAIKPEKPFSPKPLKVLLMTLVAGLGLGAGAAYMREVVDSRFYSPEEVESYLHAPVILNLPVANPSTSPGARNQVG